MMINNDNENSTNTATTTTKSNSISSNENNSLMSPIDNSNQSNGEEEKVVQNLNNDLNENQSQDKQLISVENEEQDNDDEFIRITAAHQMLTEAQSYDEQKNYPAALHLYRICVDLLLEELMFTEGTDQSRIYLREKCTAIMDRIDVLKTMLDPIPPLALSSESLPLPLTTTTDEQTTKPPTDELNSLHLS